MERTVWERWSAILLTCVLGGVVAYCAFRFAFPILLPFLLAWMISVPLRPLSRKLSRRLHLPHGLCVAVLLLFIVGLGAWGLGAAIVRLMEELGELVTRLLSDGEVMEALERTMTWLQTLAEKVGLEALHSDKRVDIYAMARDMIGNFLASVAASLPKLAASLFSSLPTVLLVIFLTVIAGYYFCVDDGHIRAVLLSYLPAKWQERLDNVKRRGRGIVGRYIKAYLLLWALTFAMLLVGLLILRVEYAFLLALIISVLDLLPVIGVGTVLLPWGLIMLLGRHFFVGFGLLILYLIIALVRQIAEPKLIGKSLGLHPLLTLFATYAGFLLFGVVGMILGPIVALILKQLLPMKREV